MDYISQNLDIEILAKTDVGKKRTRNEDNFIQLTKSIGEIKRPGNTHKLATTKEKSYFFSQFINLLTKTKFITEKNTKSLTKKIHILFNKAGLDRDEVNILLGIISSINKKIKK